VELVKAPQRLANFRKGFILFVDGVAVELTISGKSIAPPVGMGLVQNFGDIVGGPISSTVRNVCVKLFCAVTTLSSL
jgi:hypothetical protein